MSGVADAASDRSAVVGAQCGYHIPDLRGRVAIVSGAGSVGPGIGNGRAAAILLARAGARVAVVDVSPNGANDTVELIEDEGNTAFGMMADATDSRAVALVVDEVMERFGRVDVLVNNVGVTGSPLDVVDVDPDEFDHVFRVNVNSILLMSKFVVPRMVAGGRGGSIVNVASGAGLLAGYPGIAYPTSKAAVVMMTRAMAFHHGPDGVRVNCVAPGYVYTPRVAIRDGDGEEARRRRQARRLAAPLRTEGTGWDVGSAVVYLASDMARWTTGVVLPVDAGFTAGKS